MNLPVRGLFIILIFQGSTASILSKASDLFSSAFEEVSSSISSIVNAKTNLKASGFLNSLKITEDGVLNLTGLIQELNLTDNVNIPNIISSENVTVLEDGLLDLKSLVQDFNLTNVNFSDVLSLLNVKILDGVLNFTGLSETITNYANFTEFLSTIRANQSTTNNQFNTEDGLLDFIGLAEKYTGTVISYNVTTEDGYILNVFRIPSKGNCSDVVLISHGVFSSSDDFILRGNTSLVYMLAQKGYDVWVMNYRGNRYSRNHVSLNPDTDAGFWNYSMHEFGYYDLSAVIDFALNTTNKEQLSVIGHSEGTSAVFVLTSTKPEYNNKIKEFVALSPVVYLADSGLALTTLIRLGPVLNEILLALGVQELFGYESLERKLLQFLCSQGTVGYDLCVKVGIAAIAGYDPDQLEPEFFTTVLGHSPAGTSRKNLIHYVQVGNNNRFAQYDYGSDNEIRYGTVTAPDYDLAKVTCNVTLFMGKNDLIVGLKDAERVKKLLPNVRSYNVLDYNLFNHLDFLYAKDAHKDLYPQVMDVLN